jgi:hypothetical protein
MIGFDRCIRLEWMDALASMLLDGGEGDVRSKMEDFLSSEVPSDTARKKTLTVLLHIWGVIPSSSAPLRAEALELFPSVRPEVRKALHWGMTLAAYPFFRDVAGWVGRLIGLQQHIAIADLKERMCRKWGDRERVRRSTRHAAQTMREWNVLSPTDTPGKYVAPGSQIELTGEAGCWLLSAAVLASDQKFVDLEEARQLPYLYPFRCEVSVAALRSSSHIGLSTTAGRVTLAGEHA